MPAQEKEDVARKSRHDDDDDDDGSDEKKRTRRDLIGSAISSFSLLVHPGSSLPSAFVLIPGVRRIEPRSVRVQPGRLHHQRETCFLLMSSTKLALAALSAQQRLNEISSPGRNAGSKSKEFPAVHHTGSNTRSAINAADGIISDKRGCTNVRGDCRRRLGRERCKWAPGFFRPATRHVGSSPQTRHVGREDAVGTRDNLPFAPMALPAEDQRRNEPLVFAARSEVMDVGLPVCLTATAASSVPVSKEQIGQQRQSDRKHIYIFSQQGGPF
ncbi:hypothetical protein HPB50_004587 [Hyalomma asiaticum]|uniref:Uncharacterized protein n=1 Tax=Hyalomma asiaticum TaxID=266040 RepID=A0ACB7TCH1_HYAAI|nr:hypothetical protein HPB50_004587 [Hyalomma asiaticum]